MTPPPLRALRVAGAIAAVTLAAGHGLADEGQWTPDQIAELDAAKLRRMGLTLTAKDLWSKDGGLMRAAVNLSGCSSSFVSPRGLIATNHHCAHRAIQGNSSVESDYLKDGFLAKTQKDELPAKGYTVTVLRRVTDVSKTIAEASAGAKDDRSRFEAAERAKKKLVADCEKKPAARCLVGSFYRGASYKLFESVELRDVRLVYAPPAGIGEYGGDIDNWMWPRHTGDFTLLRAYAKKGGEPADHSPDNVPYEPQHHLKVSPEGVRPGDFVGIMGYPRRTHRYLSDTEATRYVEQVFPGTIDLYGEWIAILEEHGRRDPAVKIKVASHRKSLANRHKNARGMLAGIARMKLLDRKRAERKKLEAWAGGKEGYTAVLPGLDELSKGRRKTFSRDFLLGRLQYGPGLLALAIDVVRRARERARPDLERPDRYMDRNAARLWTLQERRLRNFDADVEGELLASVFARGAALPEDQRVPALAKAAGKPGDRASFLAGAKAKVRASKLAGDGVAKTLWDEAAVEKIDASADPMIALARELVESIEASEAEDAARGGRSLAIGPKYFEMLKAVRGGAVYPDANGTLRFSFATVKGYEPRDGLIASPQTTLSGALDKHTGEEPFDLPARARERAAAASDTYWADPGLEDVPLCFLSNGDTTGGNSGSPVIDGRGRLVGLNFDRVWENIAGDFGYNVKRSRNISVDVRYLLWLLDRVEGADRLLDELGVSQFRASGRRAQGGSRPKGGAAPAGSAAPGSPASSSAGCGCSVPRPGAPAPWLALLGLAGLRATRRGRRAS